MLPYLPIENLKGVGAKRAEQFHALGVDDIDALLHYYPRDYEDWSTPVPIAGADLLEKPVCVEAVVASAPSRFRSKNGVLVFETKAYDQTGTVKILIFNNKYAAAKLVRGATLLFFGRVTRGNSGYEMLSPAIEERSAKKRIRPIYRRTKGLSSKMIEASVERALTDYLNMELDPIPEEILARYDLMPLKQALTQIHFPTDMEAMAQARRRFIFEELFELELGLFRIRERNRETSDVILRQDFHDEFYARLPFAPTGAQRRAVDNAMEDLRSGILMNRLVQGDVGSGKTLVAATICYNMAKNGWQSALMAPTEILAEQHYETLSGFLAGTGVTVALLTGSMKASEKRAVREGLAHGDIDLCVGTHALISDDVRFWNLGLVITDEQHRFGVRQRGLLAEKGTGAHVLVMSATPIPRTLALAIYGDLDVSVIDELPAGRIPVKTYRIDSTKRGRVFNYIKKFLDAGKQGYIVCPLVEESEASEGLELLSAVDYYARISNNEFRDYRVGLLHGQMKAEEKADVMARFVRGEIQLLVATVVIEVGVDVPNAVIMLIENAERFGLSQLHQLRGRVGRGKDESTCVLLSDSRADVTQRRLQIMCSTNDGFEIAQEDLALRGPGDFFGQRQHGLPELHIADMTEDMAVLTQAEEAARTLLSGDPELTAPAHKNLAQETNKLFARNQSTC